MTLFAAYCMERKSSLIYIVFVFIIILVLLFYYITSVRNPPQSVNIVNLNTSSLYNLSFTVTPTFNLYSGQLYLLIKVINRGNKTITYSSGCVSPFSGNVNPNSTATLSYLKNTATCYTIALQSLKANQSAVLIWPHSPEFIRVIRNGEFAVNLTFSVWILRQRRSWLHQREYFLQLQFICFCHIESDCHLKHDF